MPHEGFALAFACLLPACSAIWVSEPPRRATHGPVDCTTSKVLPTLDSLAAATIAILAVTMAVQGVACEGGSDVCPAYFLGATVLGATSAPLITSAAFGFSGTARCRDAVRWQAPIRERPSPVPGKP
jgi:hypothetical protein